MKQYRVCHNPYVHCRTGSLEMLAQTTAELNNVHCRTGSLEISDFTAQSEKAVHCRTGSLESGGFRI